MHWVEAESRKHFNEPVLSIDGLARLIGCGIDYWDSYYIIHTHNNEIKWCTAVGSSVTFLNELRSSNISYLMRGRLWSDFNRLDNELIFLGIPKRMEFLLDIRMDEVVG